MSEPSQFVIHCTALTLAEHLASEQAAEITWPDGEGEWPGNFMATMGGLRVVVRVEEA